MGGTHSILSPSKSALTAICRGSLALCKGLPNPTNEHAASGTCTHWLGQQLLSHGDMPENYLGKTLAFDDYKFKIDRDRCDRVHVYAEAVQREPHDFIDVEVTLDTSEVVGVPGQSGTADVVMGHFETATLIIDDLKDGANLIYAPRNKQFAIYGAAALAKYDFVCDWKFIKVRVQQPRMEHFDEYTYTREELLEFINEFRPALQEAYRLYVSGTSQEIYDALTPGAHCSGMYCLARGTCAKRTAGVLELFPVAGDEPEALTLADEEVASALGRTDEIESWCRDIRAEALRRALAGRKLPGWKVVQGKRGNRKWIDEVKAAQALEFAMNEWDMYEPRELCSPTVIEKHLKKSKTLDYDKTIAPMVTQADGSLSIVPESSERVEVTVSNLEFGVVA